MQVLGPSPPHPSSLPNPTTARVRSIRCYLARTDLTPDGVLDLLVAYNGPYIIYTVEMIGASELGVSHNARHIQVFRNTDVVEPPHVDA